MKHQPTNQPYPNVACWIIVKVTINGNWFMLYGLSLIGIMIVLKVYCFSYYLYVIAIYTCMFFFNF